MGRATLYTDWKLNLGGTKKMLFFDLIGSFTKGKYTTENHRKQTRFLTELGSESFSV